ncbi:MAG: hypothetical protein KGL55_14460 [Rhodospirillales bacterium]|nr:hypothetical protein [Rhodospirillales bacterium]MDE2576507.1 hypothetical protein [Rhodospirillales bacterium]
MEDDLIALLARRAGLALALAAFPEDVAAAARALRPDPMPEGELPPEAEPWPPMRPALSDTPPMRPALSDGPPIRSAPSA